ncbi:MAG: shikimate kinase [Clostridia bacterium]|nr:shikimate kinase [Clostridia bacterium]
MENLILIGFMGTGKSAVGRVLAQKLKREFVDMDEIIEAREGLTVKEIFVQKGEPYFRELESQLVAELEDREDLVIAAGGGVVLNLENVCALQNNGILIRLMAAPPTIVQRVQADSKPRPLLEQKGHLLLCVQVLTKMREGFYIGAANYTVKTDDKTVEEVAEYILNAIWPEIAG